MKVFVAIGRWDYEGYDEPIGVFKTEKRARAAIETGYKGYDGTDVIAYQIDEAGSILVETAKPIPAKKKKGKAQ